MKTPLRIAVGAAFAAPLALTPVSGAALRLVESIPVADIDVPAAGATRTVSPASSDFYAGVGITARWTSVTASGGGDAPWSADLDITVTPPFATPIDWDFVGGEISIADYPLADATGTFLEPTTAGDYEWTFDGTPAPYIAGLRDVELHFLAAEPDVVDVINGTLIDRPLWNRPFSIIGISGLGPVSYEAIEFTVPVSGLYTLESVHPDLNDHWASLYEGDFDSTLPLTNQLDYGLGNGFDSNGSPRGVALINALLFQGRTYTIVTSQWASFRPQTTYTLTITGPASIAIAGDCPADLTADGAVDASDLAELLAGWASPGVTDLNADGTTDATDLAVLLAAWGSCS